MFTHLSTGDEDLILLCQCTNQKLGKENIGNNQGNVNWLDVTTHQDNAVSAVPVPLRYRQQLRLWTNNAVNNIINQKHLWSLHNIKHLELCSYEMITKKTISWRTTTPRAQKIAFPLSWTSRFSLWARNLSFLLDWWAEDQASHLPTRLSKEQTKTCLGQAKVKSYLSRGKFLLSSACRYEIVASCHRNYAKLKKFQYSKKWEVHLNSWVEYVSRDSPCSSTYDSLCHSHHTAEVTPHYHLCGKSGRTWGKRKKNVKDKFVCCFTLQDLLLGKYH